MLARSLIALGLVVLLGVPLLLRPFQRAEVDDLAGAPTLIVITPHVEQITDEFAEGFDRWHRRVHGSPARLDIRTPGGTTEIIRQLQAQYGAALRNEQIRAQLVMSGATPLLPAGTIPFDILFGGGSYDHSRLVRDGPVAQTAIGEVPIPMSIPAGFDQARLDDWFGENRIGAAPIYDPAQHWIGVALSSFGIVYNRDVLARLGLEEPASFDDLTARGYAGWLALADPRHSGSITTTFDSILNNQGWNNGWRILRSLCANARYFTNMSTKPPIDISHGEAAAGLAIDFYGRSQAQAVMRPGETPETSRVGYAEPAGDVFVDPDPISILNGGPNRELARRFIEFALSDEGQALWQFPARTRPDGSPNPAAADNPPGPDGEPMGPRLYELRRLPVRRDFIARYESAFVDNVDPFAIASDTTSRGWRGAIPMMMGAFGIDTHEECRRAWLEVSSAYVAQNPSPATREATMLFFAFPTGEQVEDTWIRLFGNDPIPEDVCRDFTPETYASIYKVWREDANVRSRLAIVYAEVFKENYAKVLELLAEAP